MKKFITFALIAAMMLTMLVANVSADAWDGTSVSESLKGEGTVASPYLVESAADLAFLAKSVNAGNQYGGMYFTQTADIDLGNKEWTPIGNVDSGFRGIYDGKGHKITGFYKKITEKYNGLFGVVKSTGNTQAAILNLTLEGKVDTWSFNTKSQVNVGGLTASVTGTATQHVVIANCVVDVDITANAPTLADGQFDYAAGVGPHP